MNRKEMAILAQKTAASVKLPETGCRVVVIVTDKSGDWIGVGSTTDRSDTEAMIWHALHGLDRVDHDHAELVN